MYFDKKVYTPSELPSFEEAREALPSPIWDENPEWVELYWKAWEIAFSNLQSPPEGSPLVANWIDEGLSPQVFQWDTHFMAMFGRYAFHVFPFIESHDNFYARQHEDGMICRIINEADGADHHWGLGENYARTINPPLFSWAEMEYFKFSGDTVRLARVLPPIRKYVEWVEKHRRAEGTEHQLYWSNGQASGMDNTPRDMGPMFIENIIGIVADGSANRVTWRTDATSRHGISNLHFGHVTTTLIREGNTISVESTAPYTLVVNGVESQVAEGTTQILCQ